MSWPWDKPQPDVEGTSNVKKPVSDSQEIDDIPEEKTEKKSSWL